MLDVNTWSKFYWENENNHWKNLAEEINNSTPYEAAIHIAQKIKKINNDYFQECAELSLGYYPTVETEKKYKKLKKLLGEKLQSINMNDWINQIIKNGEKGNIFFYYFEKQLTLDNTTQIISQLTNYDSTVVDFLKNKIIKEEKEQNLQSYHTALNHHLTNMIENKEEENINFVIDFFNQEKEKKWFKQHLNYILSYRTFLLYIANIIEDTNENLEKITSFFNNNADTSKLLEFNTNILAYIEAFSNQERLSQFVKNLPLESKAAFKKIVFGDITTIESLQTWYELILTTEKTPKDFFEKIWNHEQKGLRMVYNIEPESIILDFFAEKMTHYYSKEELEKYDFKKSMIDNDNLQEIMQKKIRYYYLENKLIPQNKKTKQFKI